MEKKGEMAIGVVIAVAIGLLILIVLAVVLFGGGKKLDSGIRCTAAGGVCKVDECTEGKESQIVILKNPSIDFNLVTNPDIACPAGIFCCKPTIPTDIGSS